MNSLYRLHRILVVLIVGLLVLSGCKPQVPSRYIQPDDMEAILYDYYLAQAMANRSDNPAFNQTLYYQAVLQKHGVSEAEFDSSLVYYYTHADRLGKIYSKLSDRMNVEATRLGASVGEMGKYANLNANGDTANIWRDRTVAMLLPAAPYNRMDFTVPSDTTFRKGDSFQLNLMVDFMYQSGYKDGLLYVAVDYANDSTAVYQTRISYSGLCTLTIPSNPDNDIRQLRGFIFLGQGGDGSILQKLMFINGIQLIRFRRQEQPSGGVAVPRPDSVATPAQPQQEAATQSVKVEPAPASTPPRQETKPKVERLTIGSPLKIKKKQ